MTDIMRIRVAWSGVPVIGPGVSTFYFVSGGTGIPAALVTLFTALKNYVPTGVSWVIPNDLDIINAESGELTGATTLTGGGTVLSSGGAVDYKPGVGGRIVWSTAGFTRGRRVRGTTFLVPMTSQEIPNGQVQTGTRANIVTACNAFMATGGFVPAVYTKPKPAPGGIGPATPGKRELITGASVPPGMTWLRSRRT